MDPSIFEHDVTISDADQERVDRILIILSSHRGAEEKISKADLYRKLNPPQASLWEGGIIPDRKIRSLIEWARSHTTRGAMICSSIEGGYYMARDLSELNLSLEADVNRLKHLALRIREQRKLAGLSYSPQLELFTGGDV